ncbi:hypothetical protein ACTFIR_012235 [Dictyostelium discoideum]
MLPKELDFTERILTVAKTNVIGTLNTVLPMVPIFESRGSGQLILMSSITSKFDYVMAGYSSSKGYIKSFGLILRNGLASRGVGVSVITPGFIYTQMADSFEYKDMPMVLPITTDEASKYIVDGISRNDAIISFPPLIYCISLFVATIPPTLRDATNFIINSLAKYPDYSKPVTHYSHHSQYSTNELKRENCPSSPVMNSNNQKIKTHNI